MEKGDQARDGWNEQTQKIWVNACGGTAQETCTLKAFCENFLRGVREAGVSFDKIDMLCVATIFSDPGDEEELSPNPVVTRRQFALFLQHFGPLEKSLEKIRDVLLNGMYWFHGSQSRLASERLLLEQSEEKRFLLRYSSNPGAFTVDYIKSNKICHFNNIRNDPTGGVDVVVGQQPNQQTYKYSNLSTFISKNQHIFKDACVNNRSQFQVLKQRLANPQSYRSLDDFLAGPFPTNSFHDASSDEYSTEESDTGDEEDEDESVDTEEPMSPRHSPRNSPDPKRQDLKKRGSGDKKTTKKSKDDAKKVVKKEKSRSSLLKNKFRKKQKAKIEVAPEELDPRYDQLIEEAYSSDKRSLDLKAANLGPTFPGQVCHLEDLVHLDLSHNSLTYLPDALGNLRKLKSLDLSDNKLTSLNPSLFNSFRKLSSLICADNLLTALPDSLFEGRCRNTLSYLDFSCNQLTAIPKSISNLKYKLQFLDLSLNAIEQLPQSVEKLTYLEEFYIKGNKLKALPRRMSTMINLMVLDVADNAIVELPDDLFNLIQAMPGFVLITTGNPIDSQAVEARLREGTAVPKSMASAMDFFDVLNMFRNNDSSKDTSAPRLSSSNDSSVSSSSSGVSPTLPVGGLSASAPISIPPIPIPGAASGSVGAGGSPASVRAALPTPASPTSPTSTASATPATSTPATPVVPASAPASSPTSASSAGAPIVTPPGSLVLRKSLAEQSLWKMREGYRLEGQGTEGALQNLTGGTSVTLYEHFTSLDYRRYFFQKSVHTNIIGTEKKIGPVCISIQKQSHKSDDNQEKETYRALVRTIDGDFVVQLPGSQVKLRKKERYARSNDLLLALKKHLTSTSKLPWTFKHLYVVRDNISHQAFVELENKLSVNSYKFGVLYAKEGQDEVAMYNNVEASPGFEEFLDVLGKKIDMLDWPNYCAGLDNTRPGKSVYTTLQGHEIMFHVCTYLPYLKKTDELQQQWDRKRHIGNDIVVIVYYEGSKPIDPATFESQYNHVFALVQPQPETNPTHYKLYMVYKEGVSPLIDIRPPLPPDFLLEKGPAFREFLLTKLINAERCALSAPRFAKPAQRVRTTLFSELQDQFPKQKEQKFKIPRAPGSRKKRSTTPRSPQPLGEDALFEPEDTAALRSEYMTPALAQQICRELEILEKQEGDKKGSKGL
jgi:RAP1 GTPase activating protein 1